MNEDSLSHSVSWRKVRRRIAVYLAILIAPLVFCVGGSIVTHVYNDIRLDWFADSLYEFPLPPNTEVIEQRSKVGLFGNGNHCDFFAEQEMMTLLTRQEIEQYYMNVRLPAVFRFWATRRQGDWVDVWVTFSDNAAPDGRLRFIALIGAVGYEPGLDLRCS